MAGESPDRSERERSSGETADDTGSVPAARRHDPREAFAARAGDTDDSGATGEAEESGAPVESGEPGEPAESGDARLRAAVAAWVSGSEPEDGVSEVPEDSADDDEAAGGEGAQEARSELPVRPRTTAPAEPAGKDTPTTMFGAVRPEEPAADKESAAARAERLTTAFFGSSRAAAEDAAERGDTDGDTDGAQDAPAADEPPPASGHADSDEGPDAPAGSGEGGSAPAAPAPQEDDAVEDADPPAQTGEEPAAASDAADGADRVQEAGKSAEPEARGSAAATPGDEKTATGDRPEPDDGGTGAVESGGEVPETGLSGHGETDGDGPPGTGEPSSETDEARGSDASDAGAEREPPRDRATAVFQAVAPAKAAGATAAKTDQPTTAIRLPKDKDQDGGLDQEAGAVTKPGEAEAGDAPAEDVRDDAGVSRFVPLRSGDEPRSPGPLPAAVATGTGETGTGKSGTAEGAGVGGEQERTKQQPVPEPPPLELLAQLTNKPAPPKTPMRTAVRRVKIWTPLVALLALVFVVVQSVRPLPEPTLTLTADATHTFAGGQPSLPWPGEGQAYVEVSGLGVLGSSGEQKPVPIGSVAKTMTAYLVLKKNPLEEGEDGPTITIDKKAEAGGKRGEGNGNESVLDGVQAGDKLSQRQALSALMIPSANNIARLLARWHSGSEAAFVEEMNETAEQLGMENTTYTDPSGLKESTVSTAADQVKLGKKVMEFPGLVEITKLPYWENPFTGERMRNYNTLVPFNGAVGIKTGTTTAAGGNLLFAGYKDVGGTRQLIVGAVLGQHKTPIIDTVNAVSRDLLDAAGDTLTSDTIVRKGDVVGYLDDGLGGRTPVVATEDVQAVGWGGLEVDLALEAGTGKDGSGPAPHSAPAGEKVGVLTVGGGPGQVEVPVALQEKLTEPGFGDRLTRIL